jgi:hypothetical protein
LGSWDQAGFTILLCASRDIDSVTLKTESFQYASQLPSGATVLIQIDLFALREPALKLLKLAFKGGSAFAERKSRLADHVASTRIHYMTPDEIMKAPGPR